MPDAPKHPHQKFLEKVLQDQADDSLKALNNLAKRGSAPIRIIAGVERPDYNFTGRRPEWDEWGLRLAVAVSTRADCTRRKVGAVIMTPDRSIVATGYNGASAGEPGCLSDGACPRGQKSTDEVSPGSSYDTGAGSCIAVHAEANALLRATWSLLPGATIYCTEEPCDGCLRLIKGTPIARIVTPSGVIALKP